MAQSLRRLVLAALLAVVMLLFTRSTYAAFVENELVATYLFLDGFSYQIPLLKKNWSGEAFCFWSGVECVNTTNSTSVSVKLSGMDLKGAMPEITNPVTGYNVRVTSIDLSNNTGLTGTFNSDWGVLKNLKHLDLSNTNFYGPIPDAWNGMTALESVKISNTYACKNLPSWNISTLRTADLSMNKLAGQLMSSWSGMTNLTSLDISGNSFCGCVPSTWTSTLLQSAAASIGGNLVSASCNSSNKCGSANYKCQNAAAAPAPMILAAVALVMATMAIVSF